LTVRLASQARRIGLGGLVENSQQIQSIFEALSPGTSLASLRSYDLYFRNAESL
jgi:hypothetical protein